jgi:SAM-dependent methyltransferase
MPKSLIRRIAGKLRNTNAASADYDEYTYWNKREDPNNPDGWTDERRLRCIDYIREQTEGCTSILELGPGVGRTLEAHTPARRIRGYDISELYKDRLLARANELGLNMELDIASAPNEPLPYQDKEFDAGVSCQVLLHQKPEHIERVMAELIRVCKKAIVITGGYRVGDLRGQHVFNHDYPSICTNIGCEMHHVRAYPPLIFYVYEPISTTP